MEENRKILPQFQFMSHTPHKPQKKADFSGEWRKRRK